MLKLQNAKDCQWDLVSLGEILLRFDPGEFPIVHARDFRVWDGGAEYNVAANAARVFGQRAAVATALNDDRIGRLAEDLAKGSGVDVSLIDWRTGARNGLYFIERGLGLRAPASAFDRANTAVSGLKSGEIDWPAIFKTRRARWFHTGGVFAGLSKTTPAVAIEAMMAARNHRTIVSYDLNYRGSLWDGRGGRTAANKVNSKLLEHADVVFGTFKFQPSLANCDEGAYADAARGMFERFPNLKLVVSTLRETHSASMHDFGAICTDGKNVYRSRDHLNINVLDRVGSGDAFAAGFIASMLEGRDLGFAVNCGAALGSLAMTTPGDVAMAASGDVHSLMEDSDAAVKR